MLSIYVYIYMHMIIFVFMSSMARPGWPGCDKMVPDLSEVSD
jgi:hypothetical protein